MRQCSRNRLIAIAGAACLGGLRLWSESANPFTSNAGPSSQAVAERLTGPVAAIVAAMAPLLHVLSDRLAELTRSIKGASGPGPLIALLLVSFVYGIFHALGPGHGKTLVSTFFLARDAGIKHSLAAGYLIALVHAVSALTLVSVLFFAIRGFFPSNFESASRVLRMVSFGLIAALGAVLVVRRSLGLEHRHGSGHDHMHSHAERNDGHGNHDSEEASGQNAESVAQEPGTELRVRELWGVALASGIVPCPGASAVILLSLSLNMVLVSVLAVGMISLGMGVTVSAIGALAILAKRGVIRSGRGASGGERRTLRRIVEIGGSAMLFLFGLLFFLAQF
ncbi:MAG TPA: hypothetical protein VMC79_11810 [Rectinemataceae bacterium]|nr:hypothetical protein [Rectinemataceae bacterium]